MHNGDYDGGVLYLAIVFAVILTLAAIVWFVGAFLFWAFVIVAIAVMFIGAPAFMRGFARGWKTERNAGDSNPERH